MTEHLPKPPEPDPRIFSVDPIDVGWSLTSDPVGEPLVFLSGARAEAAARKLARASAKCGVVAQV